MFKLSNFDYILPKELIAQYPLRQRDQARLMVLNRAKGEIRHIIFKDIADYFSSQDLLVLNDTKVLPCRLKGKRPTGGKVEVLLLKHQEDFIFDCLIKPARIKIEERLIFNHGGLSGIVISRNRIRINAKDINAIYSHGTMPLPPYIKREPAQADFSDYQTVYASSSGAVASPTAGLHFTQGLLRKIALSGVNVAYLTLHVGQATFKPVRTEDIRRHKMEPERFFIPEQTADLIRKTQKQKKRIFAVGTTSLRALEASVSGPNEGQTGLFIFPGYKFKVADCLITNFHLPRTTLFILVSTFAGEKLIRQAYQEAIERKYRFYSYGDAMLII